MAKVPPASSSRVADADTTLRFEGAWRVVGAHEAGAVVSAVPAKKEVAIAAIEKEPLELATQLNRRSTHVHVLKHHRRASHFKPLSRRAAVAELTGALPAPDARVVVVHVTRMQLTHPGRAEVKRMTAWLSHAACLCDGIGRGCVA